jgi:hypothetical protein
MSASPYLVRQLATFATTQYTAGVPEAVRDDIVNRLLPDFR